MLGKLTQAARTRFGFGVAAEFQRWAAQKQMKFILLVGFSLMFAIVSLGNEKRPIIDSVKAVVDQEPAIERWLLENFEFEARGHSPRIDDAREGILPQVAGRPIGPYSLWAKPKAWSGPSCFIIIVKTKISFFDSGGLKLEKPFNATSVSETFESIEIKPLEIPDSRLLGEWHATKIEGMIANYYHDVAWIMSLDRRLSMKAQTSEGSKEYFQDYDLKNGRMFIGDRESNIWNIHDYRFEDSMLIVEQFYKGELYIRFIFAKTSR